MKISVSDVEHVARLARLDPDEHEIARLQQDMDAILSYMDRLNQIGTQGIEPTVHTRPMAAPLRDDECTPSQVLAEALQNSPRIKDGLIEIPRILE